MCEFSAFNQKISSLSENVAEAVHDMEVQNRNVNLLNENIKILQNELAKKKTKKKMKSSNLLWTVFDSLSFTRQCSILYQQEEMAKLSQINNNNNNLNNC